jgi:hypothetical protein
VSTSPAALAGATPMGADKSRLQIASICRLLPTPVDPTAGTFVLNRLAALAGIADVSVIQPVPFFPALRPMPGWASEPRRSLAGLNISHAPMFYIPGVFKSQDGRWLARSIRKALRALRDAGRLQVIDAHFGYPEGVGCAHIAEELGLPYFITIRGLETDVLARPVVGEQLLRALRGARGLISVSHSLLDLVAAKGVDPGCVLVAPNAVDRAVFRPGSRAEARARLNVSNDQPLIVSVGHLLSVKRHTVLLGRARPVARARAGETRHRWRGVSRAAVPSCAARPDRARRSRGCGCYRRQAAPGAGCGLASSRESIRSCISPGGMLQRCARSAGDGRRGGCNARGRQSAFRAGRRQRLSRPAG